MAELEVSKHVKKIFQSISSKNEKGFWHKLLEFFLEIFAIVFAVSLSIWLHGWSDERHKRENVKEFLIDLKVDLMADKVEIEKSKNYILEGMDVSYQRKDSIVIDSKKMTNTNERIVLKTISRKTNSGNYEGFKSSGNIAYIENKPLKSKILKYYEQDTKFLEDREQEFNKQRDKVLDIALRSDKKLLQPNKILLYEYQGSVLMKYDELLKNIDDILKEVNHEIK